MNWAVVAPAVLLVICGGWLGGVALWQVWSPQRAWERARMDRVSGRSNVDLGWLRHKRQTAALYVAAGLILVGMGGYWIVTGIG
jgi:hypothetical protein